ncbi:TonB-dependent receptor plug domain-containing protein [Novacetimonas hansenii]|uniref:TonB-dependent receptor n=1 Tax=Novacetimonas hansenii TaxID=436 RepID=A0AAW5ERV5_NOVHA|nr:TonB-dependent receptor [Novacetimonas hansenii]MCJ8353239.1 TonB-dependent receptor [Novacetimonas hansenii]
MSRPSECSRLSPKGGRMELASFIQHATIARSCHDRAHDASGIGNPVLKQWGSSHFASALVAATLLSGPISASAQTVVASSVLAKKTKDTHAYAQAQQGNAGVATRPAPLSAAHSAASSGIALHEGKAPSGIVSAKAEDISVNSRRIPGNSVLSPSTNPHSTTPVIIIKADDLMKTGKTDLTQALTQMVSSVTSPPHNGEGGGAFTQTIALRGLSPDETLILVNGHRRHIGANFNVNPGPNVGSEPADLSLIPIGAVDHIEVITEGATALYGADAIAGAINIVLKSDVSGGTINFENSGYYQGDGQAIDGYGDYGWKIGHRGGSAHLAFQVKHQLPTNNSGKLQGNEFPLLADGSQDPREAGFNKDVQRGLGLPKSTLENLSANIEIPLTDAIHFYSTDTFSHRRVNVAEAYRPVSQTSNVIASYYPTGMQPYLDMDEYDFEVDNGIKGTYKKFAWDTYVNYGRDYQQYNMQHTDNPSLGLASKRNFDDGSNISSQLTAGLRVSRPIRTTFLPRDIRVNFGAEYRHDTFQMTAGEYQSWANGGNGLTPGAADHPGTSPLAANNTSRDTFDGYLNLDFFVTSKWEWTLGGRATSYSSLATVETGSIGTRYGFNKRIALRANINAGYRPPTLGQEHYYFIDPFPTYQIDQLPANHAIANALGAGRLKGESSRSFTIGAEGELIPNLHYSGNLYYIAINNRLMDTTTLSGSYISSLMGMYGLGDSASNSLQFYTNALNTNTWGGDFTASYDLFTRHVGHFNFGIGLNFTDNEVRSINKTPAAAAAHGLSFVNGYSTALLLRTAPRNRENVNVTWNYGKWRVFLQEERYGSTLFLGSPAAGVSIAPFEQRPAFLTNMEVSYRVIPKLMLTVGAYNLGNKYPTRIPGWAAKAQSYVTKYSYYSPFGFSGGMYYVRASYTF